MDFPTNADGRFELVDPDTSEVHAEGQFQADGTFVLSYPSQPDAFTQLTPAQYESMLPQFPQLRRLQVRAAA